jgi:Xaa-Pro dipeptidase
VVVGGAHHAYYLSAHLARWVHHAGVVLFADGRAVLVSANRPAENAAADEALAYEANRFSTMRQEQPAACAEQLVAVMKSRGVRRYGVDASVVSSQVILQSQAQAEPIDDELHQLRRVKDTDELALMKRANACTEAMYRRARQIIEPGIQEIEVFSQLHAAAVEAAGEPLSALLGNDFACGVAGGPPRQGRQAKAGELYILDLGPAYRGYFADNCRAVAVDRRPTDAQMKLWETLVGVFPIVERMARPGVRCVEVFNAVDEYLKERTGKGMPHHLGHGVGLQPHEYPHMNPKWDDTLLAGEIFTIEPGQYAPELAGGLRLENNYLVTHGGVENLTPYPMELV